MREVFLITGATGFIGTNLVKTLVSDNRRVVILSQEKKLNHWLAPLKGSIGVYECGLLDKKLPQVINEIKPDYIFHLAADRNTLPRDVKKIYSTNFLGTVLLVEALKQNKFKLFVNTGSIEEYGDTKVTIRNNTSLNPISDYGIAKTAASLFCRKEAILNDLPIVTLRLSQVYGYYDNPTGIINSLLIKLLRKNKDVEIHSKNSQDYLFIEDAIEAYVNCISSKFKKGTIINIGSGELRSMEEVVETISGFGSKNSQSSVSTHIKSIDLKETWEMLNWKPKTTFILGLKKTYDWLVTNRTHYRTR